MCFLHTKSLCINQSSNSSSTGSSSTPLSIEFSLFEGIQVQQILSCRYWYTSENLMHLYVFVTKWPWVKTWTLSLSTLCPNFLCQWHVSRWEGRGGRCPLTLYNLTATLDSRQSVLNKLSRPGGIGFYFMVTAGQGNRGVPKKKWNKTFFQSNLSTFDVM